MFRALWLVRPNLTEHIGGDTTQIHRTAAGLRDLGVEVTLAHTPPADARAYDVAHLFHLDRLWENLDHARRLRAAGVPIALSTIWWPPDEFDRHARAGFQGWLARRFGSRAYEDLRLLQRYLIHCRAGRKFPQLSRGRLDFDRTVRELLAHAAILLPNSAAEQREIERRFGVSRPAVIVPNAADAALFGPPQEGRARRGVLCVGRLEPRKNQLALIRALADTGIPLTFVGDPGRYSAAYARRCWQAAGPHVRFVGQQPAEKLRALYHAAAVHACVSWYETPGLASLEAALCGCALVVTPGGCTREYFGDEARYAQPGDPATIRAAVEAALAQGPPAELAGRIARDYTWAAAAKKTAEAYGHQARP